MENMEHIKKASRRTGFLTIVGFLIVVASLFYSYIQLSGLEKSIEDKKTILNRQRAEIKELKNTASRFTTQIKTYVDEVDKYKSDAEKFRLEADEIRHRVEELDSTQQSLLDFLVSVTDRKKVSILGPDVDWQEVKRQINSLPSGKRKNAILNAILLAWKDIPFSMGQEGVITGFDSPRFLRYVLSTVGLEVKTKRGEPLSVTLMNRFEKVDTPKPGDLVFFKGQVGNFGFILASIGDNDSEHVGIGTLQKIAPLQIISMGNINTPYFPLRGYYRVLYPDEQ